MYFKLDKEREFFVDANNNIDKATKAVDYCKLRSLNEIKSTMCEPSPTENTNLLDSKYEDIISTQVTNFYKYEPPQNIIRKIKNQGYYLFKNMIEKKNIDMAKLLFYDNKVIYNKLQEKLINPHILKSVSNEINKKLINIEYSVSNNNSTISNSSVYFHRDLHIKSNESRINCFTIITYLDGGMVELIPESNRNPNISINNLNKFYDKKVLINLEPGDVLIYEMSILNREVIYKNHNSRRLIELYNTVYLEDLNYFLKHTGFVSCKENCDKDNSVSFVNNFKQNKFSNYLIHKLSYFNSAIGYSKLPISFITDNKEIKYLTNIIDKTKLNTEDNIYQKDNHYISNFNIKNLKIEERNKFLLYSFYLNIIIIIGIIIIGVIIFVLIIKIIN